MTIGDRNGSEVFVNQVGAKSSAWLFADFISRANRKEKAFKKAFRMLTVTLYLP